MVYFFSILIILIIVLYGSLLNELYQNCAKSIYSFFETVEAVRKEFSILCHLLCPDMINSSFLFLFVPKSFSNFDIYKPLIYIK